MMSAGTTTAAVHSSIDFRMGVLGGRDAHSYEAIGLVSKESGTSRTSSSPIGSARDPLRYCRSEIGNLPHRTVHARDRLHVESEALDRLRELRRERVRRVRLTTIGQDQ